MGTLTELPDFEKSSFDRISELLLGDTLVPGASERALEACRGSVILVTGAGGSIGSMLCERITRYSPHTVVMLDISEAALYQAHKKIGFDPDFIPLMGDIRDRTKMCQIMDKYRPVLVLHAAALKHVHMLEEPMNLVEAMRTNVIGTHQVCLAAAAYNARVVMISTDKAVNPTSVLGMTKRIAERIVAYWAHLGHQMSVVRFGNVMNSSGSAIPLFKEQIAKGGPVTVTDINMTRYMMTLTQAVELVLASAVSPGEMHILDMGDSIRILDLARMLVRMADREPGVDIDIVEIGIRPGEKLYEELMYEEEKQHAKLGDGMYSVPFQPLPKGLWSSIEDLLEVSRDINDDDLRATLRSACPEYVGGE